MAMIGWNSDLDPDIYTLIFTPENFPINHRILTTRRKGISLS